MAEFDDLDGLFWPRQYYDSIDPQASLKEYRKTAHLSFQSMS